MSASDPHNSDDQSFVPQDRVEQFVALLGRSKPRIQSQLLALLANWHDVDDVMQRTNIILWRKFDQWQPNQDFTQWACGIARLEVKNFLRTRSRDRLRFDDELIDSMDATLKSPRQELAGARLESLQQCMRKLRTQDRELIELFYREEDRSGQSTATKLGRPINTIYKALIRIRRSLFECIERSLAAEERP